MANLFALLLLISLGCLIVGLIKPSAFARFIKGELTRKRIAKIFGSAFIVSFILVGVTADTSKTNKTVQPVVTQNAEENKEQKIAAAPVQKEAVAVQPKKETVTKTPVQETQPKPTPVEPAPPAQQAPAIAQFKDGNYIVGKDIQPGTYRTRKASSGCYFARLSGFSSSFEDIIANGNPRGPAVITISATDKGFKSQNCGTWTQDLSAITSSKTSFGNGIFIVGTDIEPGTYRSIEANGCYYARLSGFSGASDDIIANGNADTSTIVTISGSDVGYSSQGCGAWSKID